MNSEATPVTPEPEKRGSSPWLMLLIIVGGFAGLFLFFALVMAALLLPALQAAREAGRRAVCVNNMKMIGIALQGYHDTYQSFPPAFVADENGRPMHSWRVLILPFLEDGMAAQAYEQYDFDEPWDGPHNRAIAVIMPTVFRCPSGEDEAVHTNYVAVVGDATMWPAADAVTFRDVADGLSHTIAVVETAGAGIHWMEPRDLAVEQTRQGIRSDDGSGGISSQHPGGAGVLMADGSVLFLDEEAEPAHIQALLTIAGGEDVEPGTIGF